jgi:type II secretory pathway component PulC
MAQERPLTPEKQLLKFIETSKLNKAGMQAQVIRRHSLSFLDLGAWLGRVAFLKVKFEKWRHGFNLAKLDVKVVNSFLGLIVALLSIYFLSSFFVSVINLRKTPELESKTSLGKIETNFPEPSGLKKAVSYYLDKTRQRDIFTMGSKKTDPAAKPAPSAKELEIAASFKLVGISWSNDPDAMIEDSKALKTFFVKRGEMVGEAKVQAIFKDKVVLSYNGQEFELK